MGRYTRTGPSVVIVGDKEEQKFEALAQPLLINYSRCVAFLNFKLIYQQCYERLRNQE